MIREYFSPPLMLSSGLASGSITLPREDARWHIVADVSIAALRALGSLAMESPMSRYFRLVPEKWS